jgi:hypothetical protein
MEGFGRADGKKDRKKALSIWRYLSGKQSYESLGIADLPVKALSFSPTSATLSIALDICKFGHFEKEAHEVWMYGQENDLIVLDPNVAMVSIFISYDRWRIRRVDGQRL